MSIKDKWEEAEAKGEPVGFEMKWYVLRYRKPVISNVQFADQLLGSYQKRRVRRTYLTNDVIISTMFLCFDHNFHGGPPLLFETMIFSGNGVHNLIGRCSTWRQALAMHWRAVKEAKAQSANETP